nr:Glutamyl-tRNA(Gln) amidotransferase subunit A [uncultured bacterium]
MRRDCALALGVLCVLSLTTAAARQRGRPQVPAAPPLFDVHERSILELQAAQADGRVTSRGLVESYLARIRAYDQAGPALNAIVTLNPKALADADSLDRERASRGPRGPLHGIPVLVKDNFDTVDMPTSGGTLGLALLQPGDDAFQVKRLRDAGAVILGKTTMHELADGSTTVSSYTGQTRNPYDLARVPGGSSGGSGAAIAASFAAVGMGTDTCGSIRLPAAHQNLVGLRGTRGLSSRTGVMPMSDTQDVAGPLARSVTDLAIVLDATVGADPADAITSDSKGHIPSSYRAALAGASLKGARIGVLRALFGTAAEDEEVADVLRQALEAMKAQGAEVVDATIPGMDDLLRDSSVISDEFKFDLAAYLAKHPEAAVKSLGEILDRGLYHEALEQTLRQRNAPQRRDTEHYRLALIKRRALKDAVHDALEVQRLDVLVYPTLRRKPALIGEELRPSTITSTSLIAGTCRLSATTGLPALSMPAGFTADGLPVGLEMLAGAFAEPTLLRYAYAWEQAATPRRAPFSTPPLVNGAAPAPRVTTVSVGTAPDAAVATLTYHPATGALAYDVTIGGAARVLGLALHRPNGDQPGPLVAHLAARGQRAGRGAVTLRARHRDELLAGRMFLRLYTDRQPLGSAPVRVALP